MYFTQDYLDFFKELAANNHKEWFQENKKRYELSVKEPFNAFVQDIIDEAAKTDKRFAGLAKDAVFRIYSDVRFSKDKTPYKMHMSAVIAPGGRKEGMGIPGMYLQLGAEDFRFYSGLYQPEKEVLQMVRTYIMKHSDELNKLVADKEFVIKFGELRGERNKVMPKEFKEAALRQPYLFNKQFYFFASLPAETILKKDFSDIIMDHFKVSEPMRDYLTKARSI
jgi:uncharacterized protein (TIGR02453 family)